MKLSELGEFGLIDLINKIADKHKKYEHDTWRRLVIGIGDDAAAWMGDNNLQLVTTDTLVQDIHFDLDIVTWEELGWKALAVNLSDIAAMGGIPKYVLLSLALPGELEMENILKFVDSMAHLAEEFEVAIVGGDVVSAPNIVITITVTGCAKGKSILRRCTASPGEQIAVTGYLGSSASGLEMLKGDMRLDAETNNILRRAHLKPMPRVSEGQILVDQGVTSAIDISDGLIADLNHICEASGVGARVKIEQVPVHPLVKESFPNYQQLALCGGEDYELLFTADKAVVSRVRQILDCPVTVIGDIIKEIIPERVSLEDNEGNLVTYPRGGWEHFK